MLDSHISVAPLRIFIFLALLSTSNPYWCLLHPRLVLSSELVYKCLWFAWDVLSFNMDKRSINEFVAITQASESVAKQFLTAFDNDVQAAVEAFFEDPQKYDSAPTEPVAHFIDEEDEENLIPASEEYVRAPMQQMRRRLVAEDLPAGRGRGRHSNQPTEAFRDLRAEHIAHFSGTHSPRHLLWLR